MKRLTDNENGQALVLAALLMAVLMGFAALTVDLGTVHLTRTKMQNAADAAALAGAEDLRRGTGNPVQTAQTYGALNGAGVTEATLPAQNQIEVVCAREVPYTLARVLGFTEVNISARAVAAVTASGLLFDYALFAGGEHNSKASLSARNVVIRGNVHSDSVVEIVGEGHQIDGTVQAVDQVTIGGGLDISGTQGVEPIGMPDFTNLIAGKMAGAQVYHGHTVFSADNVTIDSPIYVDGNLTVTGRNLTVNGAVLVKGTIDIQGSGHVLGDTDVGLYAETGSIMVSGRNMDFRGMVYAPREAPQGKIDISGGDIGVRGPVVGRHINLSGEGLGAGGITVELNGPGELCVRLVE